MNDTFIKNISSIIRDASTKTPKNLTEVNSLIPIVNTGLTLDNLAQGTIDKPKTISTGSDLTQASDPTPQESPISYTIDKGFKVLAILSDEMVDSLYKGTHSNSLSYTFRAAMKSVMASFQQNVFSYLNSNISGSNLKLVVALDTPATLGIYSLIPRPMLVCGSNNYRDLLKLNVPTSFDSGYPKFIDMPITTTDEINQSSLFLFNDTSFKVITAFPNTPSNDPSTTVYDPVSGLKLLVRAKKGSNQIEISMRYGIVITKPSTLFRYDVGS